MTQHYNQLIKQKKIVLIVYMMKIKGILIRAKAKLMDGAEQNDRVWHAGLIHKLQLSGISANLLSWLQDYLNDRRQCVVISVCKSDSLPINAGVPQGSILGPLLFLVYINDIVRDIHCPVRLFADDTTLYIIVDNPVDAATQLNADLVKIHPWADKWLVTFNPSKTESLVISRKINRLIHPLFSLTTAQYTRFRLINI